MKLEQEAFEGELKKLRQIYKILQSTGYFICGEIGKKDSNNLPDRIMVCPAYGLDWFVVYEKTNNTGGPEW